MEMEIVKIKLRGRNWHDNMYSSLNSIVSINRNGFYKPCFVCKSLRFLFFTDKPGELCMENLDEVGYCCFRLIIFSKINTWAYPLKKPNT